MFRKYSMYYFFFILVLVTVTGCKKLIEVDPPISQLTTGSVFTDDNTAIAAQLAIYSQMQLTPWIINRTTALSSDEFINYSSDQNSKDLYANALNAKIDGAALVWGKAYNLIYQENAILENVQASSGISSNVKKLLIGESQLTRAYWYLYLVNLYGDVPLITSTDYKVNSVISRSPKALVYQQIISDLRSAKSLLSDKYLDATDSLPTEDRVRPTTWAASALLARAYLYNAQYDSAEIESSIVINNTSLYTLSELNSVFLKNSSEAIWQIVPPSSSFATYEGQYFILFKVPAAGGTNNSQALSTQLLGAFEPGDNRKILWINYFTDTILNRTYYYPFKYKDNSLSTKVLREYSMVLRLGEQYLIRAEARTQLNKLSDAISDINTIRRRAGLDDLSIALTQDQALQATAHERQVELFTEGQRWVDLKRTMAIDSVMNVVTPQKSGLSWNTVQQLYPLPLGDIQNGINLIQNLGY